jgi:murein DD-endopeptidase MepM/ murein hydrolase activator NlpD
MMYRNNSRSYLEISLTHSTFSKYFMHAKAVHDVEGETKKNLDRLTVLKNDLEQQQQTLQSKKTELDEAKSRLDSNKSAQEQEKLFKETLVGRVQQEAATYQQMTDEAKSEYDGSVATADALERRFREKLEETGVNLDELLGTASQLAWPVSSRLITAYFHDPDYPFGTHAAIDLATAQGTPVRASADGYVAAVKHPGMLSATVPDYAWVRISHGGDISTFYLHLSQVSVSPDQFVRKGEVIGLSGGARGVAGSGWLTTGPHLHFEVRLNGLPVNPLDYLT